MIDAATSDCNFYFEFELPGGTTSPLRKPASSMIRRNWPDRFIRSRNSLTNTSRLDRRAVGSLGRDLDADPRLRPLVLSRSATATPR